MVMRIAHAILATAISSGYCWRGFRVVSMRRKASDIDPDQATPSAVVAEPRAEGQDTTHFRYRSRGQPGCGDAFERELPVRCLLSLPVPACC